MQLQVGVLHNHLDNYFSNHLTNYFSNHFTNHFTNHLATIQGKRILSFLDIIT